MISCSCCRGPGAEKVRSVTIGGVPFTMEVPMCETCWKRGVNELLKALADRLPGAWVFGR